jgi:Xaa-Pro dipeptidase
MNLDRRRFLETAAIGSAAFAAGCGSEPTPTATAPPADGRLPAAIKALTPMTAGVVPITNDERKARLAKAQKLMSDAKLDAIFTEGTTSCFYYTGMRWGQSERTFGVVIPRQGDLAYVCPGFEEDRARELINTAFG